MRSCEEMELLMNLCLDDMLPSEEWDSLREHLETCPVCRKRFAQLREIKNALASLEEPAPAELHGRIMAYVAENTDEAVVKETSTARILRPRRWYRALAAVAACAVIAVAASQLIPSVQDNMVESLTTVPSAPGTAVDTAASATAEDTNDAVLKDTPFKQHDPMGKPESTTTIPSEQAMPDEQAGQRAEDLPPLRQENGGAANEAEAVVMKWLKAEGPKDKLPEWVDAEGVYETEMSGKMTTYIEIDVWAEAYWIDQLQACGFAVEEMEGQNLSEEGEIILLFFFWTE